MRNAVILQSIILGICAILPHHKSHALWYDWSPWTDCNVNCGTGVQTHTRTCNSDPCFGVPTETQSCVKLCGCQVAPCGAGTCIQNVGFLDMYDCACPPNYSGNNSQDCNTVFDTASSQTPLMVTTDSDFTIGSPFYPNTYPTLLGVTWTIQTSNTKLINLTFDYFNVNAPNSDNCTGDYAANVEQVLVMNAIPVNQRLNTTQVEIACPCIYDLLIVNDGNFTGITTNSQIYCNARPPPDSLTSTTDILTLRFITDQSTYTGSGRKKRQAVTTTNPGFYLNITAVSDQCLSNPCVNGGTCTDLVDAFNCTCPIPYSGVTCEITDYCYANTNCSNGATCYSLDNGYNCTCFSGYMGTHCASLDYCFNNDNCTNGGTCFSSDNGYNCTCSLGYLGTHCDIFDYCHNNQNCSNGATCFSLDTTYNCSCLPGYIGQHCNVFDSCYNNQNCSNGGTCVNLESGYNCSCTEGYTGLHCETELLCTTNNIQCDNGGTCVDNPGSWQCVCPQAWSGTNCTVYDYCHNNTNCTNGATCVSGVTGYNCTCTSRYTGTHCETELLCSTQNIQCNSVGTCVDSPGQWRCDCLQPWSGVTCSVYDYCYNNTNCTNGSTCMSGDTGYNCSCTPEYTGIHCETELVCTTQNIACGNGGTCMDVVPLNYSCVCQPMWYGPNCTQSCNSTVDLTAQNSSYTIASPNHPNPYPDFTTCSWTIQTDPGKTIQVSFTASLDISTSDGTNCLADYKSKVAAEMNKYNLGTYTGDEVVRICPCIYDQLFLYDGTSINSLAVVGTYCNGATPQQSLTSTQPGMTVIFRTDSGVTGSGHTGFTLTVTSAGDDCQDQPCQNGGTCTDLVADFSCNCTQGYTGKTCTTDVDECKRLNNCDGDPLAVCVNSPGTYNCSCQYGSMGVSWNGTACTTGKQPDNLCSVSNGRCQHICTPSVLSGSVISVVNYRCSCYAGYYLSADEVSCLDVDECLTSCNSSTDPQPSCINTPGSYGCSCEQGFQWNSTNSTCDNINECTTNNGGCDFNCTDTHGSRLCSCDIPGYRLLDNKVNCWDVDECVDNNGVCQQMCMNTFGSFHCGCQSGYVLTKDSQSCSDVNECDTFNGRCSQICNNLNGTHNCSCTPGSELAIDGQTCADVKLTCPDPSPCEGQCVAEGSTFKCVCPVGLSLSNETNCTDIDECLQKNKGGCSNNCHNTLGSYTCSCVTGFYLLPDGKNCQDLNECNQHNNCTYECLNTIGSYQCTCPNGYVLNTSSQQCDDLNECLTNNGGCQQYCENNNGSFVCKCGSGFTLWPDMKSCYYIDECVIINKASSELSKMIRIELTLNTTYNADMFDSASASFIRLSSELESALNILMDNVTYKVTVPKHNRIIPVCFRPGSVIATIDLLYSVPLNDVEVSVISYGLTAKIRENSNVLVLGDLNVGIDGDVDIVYRSPEVQTQKWTVENLCHMFNNLSVCKNGASCKEVDNIPTCQCLSGYNGTFCEVKEPMRCENCSVVTKEEGLTEFTILVLSISVPLSTFLIIIFIAILSVMFCKRRHKNNQLHVTGNEITQIQTQLIYNVRVHRSQMLTERKLDELIKYDTKHYNKHKYDNPYLGY